MNPRYLVVTEHKHPDPEYVDPDDIVWTAPSMDGAPPFLAWRVGHSPSQEVAESFARACAAEGLGTCRVIEFSSDTDDATARVVFITENA